MALQTPLPCYPSIHCTANCTTTLRELASFSELIFQRLITALVHSLVSLIMTVSVHPLTVSRQRVTVSRINMTVLRKIMTVLRKKSDCETSIKPHFDCIQPIFDCAQQNFDSVESILCSFSALFSFKHPKLFNFLVIPLLNRYSPFIDSLHNCVKCNFELLSERFTDSQKTTDIKTIQTTTDLRRLHSVSCSSPT